MKILALIALMTLASMASATTVEISNLGAENGQIFLALYDSPDAFPDQASRALKKITVPVASHQQTVKIDLDLKPGRYAISTFLDKNKNGKLDTNVVGAPKERFGFSRNPKIGMGAPNFSECAFEITQEKKVISIRLMKLF